MDWMDGLARMLPKDPGLRGVLSRRAVVMVLLAGSAQDPCVVFEERAAGIAQAGEIGFPGGMAEPSRDATVEETALREASEELGVPVGSFTPMGRLDSLVTRWGLRIDVVVARTSLGMEAFKPNPAEVSRLFGLRLSWLLAQEPLRHCLLIQSHPVRFHPETGVEEELFPAKELKLPERYHRAWGDTTVPVVSYRTPEGVIWGITGDILQNFLETIRPVFP